MKIPNSKIDDVVECHIVVFKWQSLNHQYFSTGLEKGSKTSQDDTIWIILLADVAQGTVTRFALQTLVSDPFGETGGIPRGKRIPLVMRKCPYTTTADIPQSKRILL